MIAGCQYWFPKAFGFRLAEKWGRISVFFWVLGFYLAFMPLYVLGFMGMPRRMGHYEMATWQPWLIAAEVGAILVGCGGICQVIQLVRSIRNRAALRVNTGDPWDGRTLEWMTASPPAPYNFAVIPHVHDIDELAWRKKHGVAEPESEKVLNIVMPNNTGAGMILGVLSFIFGFAMVWHVWWLAAIAAAAMLATVIVRSSNDDDEHVVRVKALKTVEAGGRLEAAE
jgi:cytochrome o ubiquinol oxidase subunit 1